MPRRRRRSRSGWATSDGWKRRCCGVARTTRGGVMATRVENPGGWVGVRKCGCCVAVTVDCASRPKDIAKTKREFLKDGLSVVYGTWDEWQTKYLPSMQRHCG